MLQTLSDALNRAVPGTERVRRSKSKSDRRLRSAWLGISVVIADLPVAIVLILWGMLLSLLQAIGLILSALGVSLLLVFKTLTWIIVGIFMGLAGYLEDVKMEGARNGK